MENTKQEHGNGIARSVLLFAFHIPYSPSQTFKSHKSGAMWAWGKGSKAAAPVVPLRTAQKAVPARWAVSASMTVSPQKSTCSGVSPRAWMAPKSPSGSGLGALT